MVRLVVTLFVHVEETCIWFTNLDRKRNANNNNIIGLEHLAEDEETHNKRRTLRTGPTKWSKRESLHKEYVLKAKEKEAQQRQTLKVPRGTYRWRDQLEVYQRFPWVELHQPKSTESDPDVLDEKANDSLISLVESRRYNGQYAQKRPTKFRDDELHPDMYDSLAVDGNPFFKPKPKYQPLHRRHATKCRPISKKTWDFNKEDEQRITLNEMNYTAHCDTGEKAFAARYLDRHAHCHGNINVQTALLKTRQSTRNGRPMPRDKLSCTKCGHSVSVAEKFGFGDAWPNLHRPQLCTCELDMFPGLKSLTRQHKDVPILNPLDQPASRILGELEKQQLEGELHIKFTRGTIPHFTSFVNQATAYFRGTDTKVFQGALHGADDMHSDSDNSPTDQWSSSSTHDFRFMDTQKPPSVKKKKPSQFDWSSASPHDGDFHRRSRESFSSATPLITNTDVKAPEKKRGSARSARRSTVGTSLLPKVTDDAPKSAAGTARPSVSAGVEAATRGARGSILKPYGQSGLDAAHSRDRASILEPRGQSSADASTRGSRASIVESHGQPALDTALLSARASIFEPRGARSSLLELPAQPDIDAGLTRARMPTPDPREQTARRASVHWSLGETGQRLPSMSQPTDTDYNDDLSDPAAIDGTKMAFEYEFSLVVRSKKRRSFDAEVAVDTEDLSFYEIWESFTHAVGAKSGTFVLQVPETDEDKKQKAEFLAAWRDFTDSVDFMRAALAGVSKHTLAKDQAVAEAAIDLFTAFEKFLYYAWKVNGTWEKSFNESTILSLLEPTKALAFLYLWKTRGYTLVEIDWSDIEGVSEEQLLVHDAWHVFINSLHLDAEEEREEKFDALDPAYQLEFFQTFRKFMFVEGFSGKTSNVRQQLVKEFCSWLAFMQGLVGDGRFAQGTIFHSIPKGQQDLVPAEAILESRDGAKGTAGNLGTTHDTKEQSAKKAEQSKLGLTAMELGGTPASRVKPLGWRITQTEEDLLEQKRQEELLAKAAGRSGCVDLPGGCPNIRLMGMPIIAWFKSNSITSNTLEETEDGMAERLQTILRRRSTIAASLLRRETVANAGTAKADVDSETVIERKMAQRLHQDSGSVDYSMGAFTYSVNEKEFDDATRLMDIWRKGKRMIKEKARMDEAEELSKTRKSTAGQYDKSRRSTAGQERKARYSTAGEQRKARYSTAEGHGKARHSTTEEQSNARTSTAENEPGETTNGMYAEVQPDLKKNVPTTKDVMKTGERKSSVPLIDADVATGGVSPDATNISQAMKHAVGVAKKLARVKKRVAKTGTKRLKKLLDTYEPNTGLHLTEKGLEMWEQTKNTRRQLIMETFNLPSRKTSRDPFRLSLKRSSTVLLATHDVAASPRAASTLLPSPDLSVGSLALRPVTPALSSLTKNVRPASRKDAHSQSADSRQPSTSHGGSNVQRNLYTIPHYILTLSQRSCRFLLPEDLRTLEDINVVEYLQRYVTPEPARKFILHRVFCNYKQKEQLNVMALIEALNEMYHNYLTEADIARVMTLVDIQDTTEIDLKLFFGIAAFVERLVFPRLVKFLTDPGAKEKYERTTDEEHDFRFLGMRLQTVDIDEDLKEILTIINTDVWGT